MDYIIGYFLLTVLYAGLSYIFFARPIFVEAANVAANKLEVGIKDLYMIGDRYWLLTWGVVCIVLFPLIALTQTILPSLLRERLMKNFINVYIDEFLDEDG